MLQNGRAEPDPTDYLGSGFDPPLSCETLYPHETSRGSPACKAEPSGALWPKPTCSSPCNHLPENLHPGSFLSVYKCITGSEIILPLGQKSHCMYRDSARTTAGSPEPLSHVDLSTSPTERSAERLTGQAWAAPPTPQGSPDSPVPLQSYLEQCRCHVEDDEDECECGMPGLHTADGVEEHQVSWNHEKEEDSGRARVHIWTGQEKG